MTQTITLSKAAAARLKATGIIRENLDHTGFAGQAAVIQGDYLSFLDRCREPFDLIFLDPPYGSGFLEKAMERIQTIDIVSGNGMGVQACGFPQTHPPGQTSDHAHGPSSFFAGDACASPLNC